jgi:hypothetical protein
MVLNVFVQSLNAELKSKANSLQLSANLGQESKR